MPYGMGEAWGVRNAGFVVVEFSMDLPDCLGTPESEESILHSPSLDHVGRKRAEPGEFEREDIKEVVRGGKCQLVLNLPVPGLLTVLGCCACC